MTLTDLAIDLDRLLRRIDALARDGARPDGGVCRLTLTDADRAGRDRVVAWMEELGLAVAIDCVGNLFGTRAGRAKDAAPVMTGSHLDSVATGGRLDGALGVLAGLEVVETLNAAGVTTRRPLVVAAFTGEEGARFAPDMLGSLVHVGALALETALATRGVDGAVLGAELERIGYAGRGAGPRAPHAFVELHVEQGPVLEAEGVTIGAVESVQGISWTRLDLAGQANHAGTTPMRLRHDAGWVAAALAAWLRELVRAVGGDQLATCGQLDPVPDLVNVIPASVRMTVDLRNPDAAGLARAEALLDAKARELAAAEGVELATERLARFDPVRFDPGVVALVERCAAARGRSVRRMTSGAGHDAQMLARVCPAGMVFVPSIGGISHNPAEATSPEDLRAGADVLLSALLELAR